MTEELRCNLPTLCWPNGRGQLQKNDARQSRRKYGCQSCRGPLTAIPVQNGSSAGNGRSFDCENVLASEPILSAQDDRVGVVIFIEPCHPERSRGFRLKPVTSATPASPWLRYQGFPHAPSTLFPEFTSACATTIFALRRPGARPARFTRHANYQECAGFCPEVFAHPSKCNIPACR